MAEEEGSDRLRLLPCEHLSLVGIVITEPSIEVEITYAGVTRRYGMYHWTESTLSRAIEARVMMLDGLSWSTLREKPSVVEVHCYDVFGNNYTYGFVPEAKRFQEI